MSLEPSFPGIILGAKAGGASGAAGGDLAGTYPNPTISNAAKQAISGGLAMTSGRFFNYNGTGAAGTPGANNRAVMSRVLFGKACTLDRIGCDITIVGNAGAKMRFGIYADADGRPGARIADFGQQAVDALAYNPLTISQAVLPTWYWICAAAQSQATILATFRTSSQIAIPWGFAHISRATGGVTASNDVAYFFDTGFSGALPDPAGTETGTISVSNSPSIWIRAA